MKLKILFIIAALAHPFPDFGQTHLNKSIPVQKGQTIRFRFDYPQLIRVSTWEGSEVVIQGIVNVNDGENDNAFTIDQSTSGNALSIRGYIKDLDGLPQRVTLIRDGQKIVLRDKAELKKFQAEHGHAYNQMSFGPHIDIVLDIKVPRNMDTFVEAVYGMVEVNNFTGPLTVEATYGGIDAAVAEKTVGEVTAETNYGEIYSNLDAKFGGSGQDKAFHTYVSAKPGTGPRYTLESKYGNVYIRKATQ